MIQCLLLNKILDDSAKVISCDGEPRFCNILLWGNSLVSLSEPKIPLGLCELVTMFPAFENFHWIPNNVHALLISGSFCRKSAARPESLSVNFSRLLTGFRLYLVCMWSDLQKQWETVKHRFSLNLQPLDLTHWIYDSSSLTKIPDINKEPRMDHLIYYSH